VRFAFLASRPRAIALFEGERIVARKTQTAHPNCDEFYV
jgi:hypothetical protein